MMDRTKILDDLDDAVVVLARDNRLLYANRAARRQLPRSDDDRTLLPWPELAELAQQAVAYGEVVRRTGVPCHGADLSWNVKLWPIGDGCVAAVIRPSVHSSDRMSLIGRRLGLTRDQARLALQVAQGRPNRDIGDELGVTVGTIKGRLWRLYRKLGVRNRAELAGQIIGALSESPLEPGLVLEEQEVHRVGGQLDRAVAIVEKMEVVVAHS